MAYKKLILFMSFVLFINLLAENVENDQRSCDSKLVFHKELIGHGNKVNALAISPDNKYIVTGSWDGMVRIWDSQTGKTIHELGENKIGRIHFITSAAVCNDSSCVITGSSDHTATIWDMNTGAIRKKLIGHNDFITTVAFSKDNNFILTSSWDYKAIIWDMAGKIKHELNHIAEVKLASISPDSKFVVTAASNIAYIWDVFTGTPKHSLVGHEQNVRSLTISADSKFVITAYNDGTVVIWESSTGLPIQTFKNHSAAIDTLSISPNNEFLISGSYDLHLCIWKIDTQKLSKCVWDTNQGWVLSTAINSGSKYAISGSADRAIRLWSLDTGEMVCKITDYSCVVTHLVFSMDHSLMCVASGSKVTVYKCIDFN